MEKAAFLAMGNLSTHPTFFERHAWVKKLFHTQETRCLAAFAKISSRTVVMKKFIVAVRSWQKRGQI